jgi:hypothetical protein
MTSLLKQEEAGNIPQILKGVLQKGMDANTNAEWSDSLKRDVFHGKTIDGMYEVNGTLYKASIQKESYLAFTANKLAKAVYELHKFMKNFQTLFANPIVPDVDQKMLELMVQAFDERKANWANVWDNHYAPNGQVTDRFLERNMEHITDDAFIGASKKSKRAFAAIFITKVANNPDYQMESLGDGAGNVVSNFIRNPLDSAAKGKFLHVHYKESDVKEDRLDSDFQWHHFLANMRKPQNVVGRRIYDVLVGTINDALQVDEFANIKDRHVWADRGRGTILMSDTIGETRAFDSGAFTPDMKASTGSWDALIKALKGIK